MERYFKTREEVGVQGISKKDYRRENLPERIRSKLRKNWMTGKLRLLYLMNLPKRQKRKSPETLEFPGFLKGDNQI